MSATYTVTILGFGNHAAIPIPDEVLKVLGTHRRAPLKVTIGNHTYQSTATAMEGQCLVVFPQRERKASGFSAGDTVQVTLELDEGKREVEMHPELIEALNFNNLMEIFETLSYSKRREHARSVSEAKAADTRTRRIERVIDSLTSQ